MGVGREEISVCWYLEKLKFYLRDFLPSYVGRKLDYNNRMLFDFFPQGGKDSPRLVFEPGL